MVINLNPEKLDLYPSEGFLKDIMFLGLCVFIFLSFVAYNNFTQLDERVEVGFVEVDTYCAGLDVGVCLGIERQTHDTYNYDDFEPVEEGTENYYRLVEAELMAQAVNICEEDEISEKDWASEAEYEDKTGDEWLENENVNLLPCEETTYRHLEATS